MYLIALTVLLSISSISSSDKVFTLNKTLDKPTLDPITSNHITSSVLQPLSDTETQIIDILKATNALPNVNVPELFMVTKGLADGRSDLILIILLSLLQRTNELTLQTNNLLLRTNALEIQIDDLTTRTNGLSALVNDLSTRTNDLTTGSANLVRTTNDLTSRTDNLMNNPVPIDYVYVQYPGMPEPRTLWSSVEWTQITSNYAGLFFRAEGGNSNSFTSGIQAAQSPRITGMEFTGNTVSNFNNVGLSYNSNGFTSSWLQSGGWSGAWCQIRFRTMHADVIPRNRAIRIWRRSA